MRPCTRELLYLNIDPEVPLNGILQLGEIPLFRMQIGAKPICHQTFDDFLEHLQKHVFELISAQDLGTQLVDHLALLVHHIIVLEEMFADFEVVAFDFPLRPFDGYGDHAMYNGLALDHA